MSISQEMRMARLEKQLETIEAENYSLRQRIAEMELEICQKFQPLREPIEVVGSWHKTRGNSL